MLGISDAVESIGFRTRGYRLTWEQLRDEVPLPCIVHWNQRYTIVILLANLFGRFKAYYLLNIWKFVFLILILSKYSDNE